ncbi:MAG: TetR/AcrR family transcriptional regulator [Euzebya sp.]
MPQIKGTKRASSTQTPQRLVAATTELLSMVGFSGTTVRAIGERAGCNAALVSYHFGSLNALLLAALDASSDARRARYDTELAEVGNWREARRVLRRLYQEDRDCGHVDLLAEMVAGGLMDRDLGRQVAFRIEPWVILIEDLIVRLVPTAALRRRLPVRELAYGITASFLGLGLLGTLTQDHSRGDAVVQRLTAERSTWRLLTAPQKPADR